MKRHLHSTCVTVLIFLLTLHAVHGDEPTRQDVIDRMRPYEGPSHGEFTDGLHRKVFCGYQGWFTTPGDGSNRGWSHYGRRGKFEPGHCSFDLWPDVTELDADEKFKTPFRYPDGSVAHVFSSHSRKTVLRHFDWMKQYGIDGVFVQRFAVETVEAARFNHCNTVLMNCREGANVHGRGYAAMYDLSGLRRDQMTTVFDDWKLLVDRMQLGRDKNDHAYLQHQGKPVVAVWGIGFNDNREYSLDECDDLIRFLKDDPRYGGCTVMLGVPTGWRTLDRDSIPDQRLHEVVLRADIISPWTIGRYHSIELVAKHAERDWQADLEWCRKHQKEYLPVVFPGFSWHNMNPRFPLDQIPRLRGRFLWSQYVQAKKAGATMIYQAMFDELDEGTAIFKCTNTPPVGMSRFLTYEDLPSDHYLWLTGMGRRLLRGEIKSTDDLPSR